MVAPGDDALFPPFDPELLADLHAGVLDPEFADRLRAATLEDPEATRTLDALDAVQADLGALRARDTPAPPIPPEVLARVQGALAEAPAPSIPLSARRRRDPVRLAAAAAAVVVVAAGAGIGIARLTTESQPDSTPPGTPLFAHSPTGGSGAGVELGDSLSPVSALSMLGHSSLGPLESPAARESCLLANGVDPSRPLLGSGPVRLRGVTGILMLFAGPRPPQITALVVGTGCSTDDPATLARADIG
ncbi:hypothetical protein [Rhodococcus sp. NPDC127528]|uniref:hypothetical protein n=1 Tax=unclassified Rhodococcus (in: high G+C Gram-positive bacteria) TaxID=192944 RepID=UPI0036361FEA